MQDAMSLDNELAADVSDELFWDPELDNSLIAVSASDRTITLRCTVGSLDHLIASWTLVDADQELLSGCTAGSGSASR
jgi:hypothetical protein